ncbi:alginate O-acetyltransferase AlgX-related protein [Tropicibacter oceani]|uniref:AlgX/AlgJ SGNH hydrolase-like domain-containing protein n=1 Tax=Tropicibacter oceani TaxID=3058420 RepID=A0ABY8QI07_9RHOB|nr:hypothetical protein [Tropicibacter oceani]WGW04286.1 hypothetical protein QF118_01735 [Tropicibacter oceani]
MTGRNTRTGRGWAAALAAVLCLGAPAQAQSSAYGCSGLETSDALPSVEGEAGMFYRIDPDLMMAHGLSDENIAHLADLSSALKAQGTTLIYLPMPTKALGQPWDLPRTARDLGYDPDVAATVYDQGLGHLAAAGVRAVDARAALASASRQQPAYFGVDSRLTTDGTRALARAVAAVITGAPSQPESAYRTGDGSLVTLPSAMRFDLQEHCHSPLPRPETRQSVMTRGTAPGQAFDAENAPAQIVLVGTKLTGEPSTNFAGHLQEHSGLSVAQYGVPDGGAFAAISSYLTSQAFRRARPDFLVWEHPVWFNLGANGDQPMRELIAAAGPDCAIALPMAFDRNAGVLRADLSRLDPQQAHTLFLDTDGAEAATARFSFYEATGLHRTRAVFRRGDQLLTGRFYMPMSGLWPEGAVSVEISLDAPSGPAPRLFACQHEGGQ